MRILVTGSRKWTDEAMVFGVLGAICSRVPAREDVVIIDGAAQGADKAASKYGSEPNGIHHERYPADWETHGKAAGHIRNKQMLDTGVDLVVAFKQEFNWGFSHGGTENCVHQARAMGIPCIVVCEAP